MRPSGSAASSNTCVQRARWLRRFLSFLAIVVRESSSSSGLLKTSLSSGAGGSYRVRSGVVWSAGSCDYCSRPAQGLKDLNHGKQLTQCWQSAPMLRPRALALSRKFS